MLGMLKKKTSGHMTITLNAKLQPMHRAELEDAFEAAAKKSKLKAKVDGGGTLLQENGEVKECDIEIQLKDASEETITAVAGLFGAMLAPIGSRYTVEGQEPIAFGRHQGLGLYLNGTDLPDQVYAQCDSNHVYSECERLLEGVGQVNSYWQGPTETALYMYGEDFETMRSRVQELVDTYPLCQKARIVRLA